ncbi:unnamed protein product [Arabidopsis halleri]
MKWLQQSAENGYVRAQYQLALCLHQGRVVKINLLEASFILMAALLVETDNAMFRHVLSSFVEIDNAMFGHVCS